MTQPPQRVIRFYSNCQYALECIAFKQITFLHNIKLNDPFDLYYHFETDFNEDYDALINHVRQHHTRNLLDFKQRLPKDNWESFVKGIEENYFRNLRNSMFIFSTSGISEDNHPKDNLYMWSHYGDGHRGVAIEFDTALLTKAILEQQKRLNGAKLDINGVWSEIYYQDELPDITCEHIFQFVMNDIESADESVWDNIELTNILRLRLSSKSIEWKIEKEWRLMWQNDETKLKVLRLDLIDDAITAIYLGCRYPLNADHMNDDIIFEAKRHFPKAKIYKMKKRKGKFTLDFEPIVVPANANLT